MFFCTMATKKKICEREVAFSVAWRDGTATVKCPTHGIVTLAPSEFIDQLNGAEPKNGVTS